MNILGLLSLMMCVGLVSAQDELDILAPVSSSKTEAELSSRQLDLEVRQIMMDKKLKELDERLKQVEGRAKSDQDAANRMTPRHVEVLKKDRPPTMDSKSSIPYPIYPVIPLQNTDPNFGQTMLPRQ